MQLTEKLMKNWIFAIAIGLTQLLVVGQATAQIGRAHV